MTQTNTKHRTIPNLRWWIGGLLLSSTIINYIDRQTLSVLAPHLKVEFHWDNRDFALIVIGFRIAYAIMQTVAGRVIDKLGTRRGLTLAVIWYSTAAALTSLATGLKSFACLRFLLGSGEAANWPGATKAVSEWFPKSERGCAVALFDSGSSVGGALAPFIVLSIYAHFGSWRPAFLITSGLGILWVLVWRACYHPPETHPNISPEEREMILRTRGEDQIAVPGSAALSTERPASWKELLRLKQTWGIVLGRGLTDPVWFFVTDWFPIFLVARGFRIEDAVVGFWVPFLAADLGNFFGGGFSSWLIRRGWPVLRARKFIVTVCGIGMSLLVFAAKVQSFPLLIGLFAVSTFAYAAWSTMGLSLPSDLYPTRSVATVAGLGGTGAGIGTIISTFLIGQVADRYSFGPILVVASMVPLVATALVLVLVRQKKQGAIA